MLGHCSLKVLKNFGVAAVLGYTQTSEFGVVQSIRVLLRSFGALQNRGQCCLGMRQLHKMATESSGLCLSFCRQSSGAQSGPGI